MVQCPDIFNFRFSDVLNNLECELCRNVNRNLRERGVEELNRILYRREMREMRSVRSGLANSMTAEDVRLAI